MPPQSPTERVLERTTIGDPPSAVVSSEIAARASTRAPLIVTQYKRLEVASHPLFVELAARPLDLSVIWLLVANLEAGISKDFVTWLAWTIARVDDRRVGSLVAQQLADELGHGKFEAIHSRLLSRFVTALAAHRPAGDDAHLLKAGRQLALAGTEIFRDGGPYEGVGALIVGEIFAEKMDHCLGDQIRRQEALSAHDLTWLTIHEVLEADHAQDSEALAELVPTHGAALAETWHGATHFWRALWNFLDSVHELAGSVSRADG